VTPSGIDPGSAGPHPTAHPVLTSIYVQALMLTNFCHLIRTVGALLWRPVDVCLFLQSS